MTPIFHNQSFPLRFSYSMDNSLFQLIHILYAIIKGNHCVHTAIL